MTRCKVLRRRPRPRCPWALRQSGRGSRHHTHGHMAEDAENARRQARPILQNCAHQVTRAAVQRGLDLHQDCATPDVGRRYGLLLLRAGSIPELLGNLVAPTTRMSQPLLVPQDLGPLLADTLLRQVLMATATFAPYCNACHFGGVRLDDAAHGEHLWVVELLLH